MPSNRNTNEPTDPIEDSDLIGAEDAADEADDDDVDEDDDIIDEEDDEEDEEDEDEVEDDEEEQGEIEAATLRTGLTAEVGGEGGSPGEAVERVRARAGLGRGSEATTTWEGGADASRDRHGEDGVLIKRAP